MLKRVSDIVIASIILIFAFIPMLVIAALIKLTSKGPCLYWSNRVGVHNIMFRMPKFRTMRVDTPAVATHLLASPENYLTPIGQFLRKSSLDELPQLWSILIGDMTFVGPRPALFNQDDLISLRTQKNIHRLKPGWAQIKGRDDISIEQKVIFESEYFAKQSFMLDLKILVMTFFKVIKREGVSH